MQLVIYYFTITNLFDDSDSPIFVLETIKLLLNATEPYSQNGVSLHCVFDMRPSHTIFIRFYSFE